MAAVIQLCRLHREEERVLYFAVVQFRLKERWLLGFDTSKLTSLGVALLVLFT